MNSTQPLMDMDEGISASNASLTITPSTDIFTDAMYLVVLILSSFLLLTLNSVCLLVLSQITSINDTTKVFLRSMTAADLGVGIFMAVPMTVCAAVGGWPFGIVFCGIQTFISISVILGSLLSLLLLTVDRYISVVYALCYHSIVTMKRARIAVGCVWGIIAAMVCVAGVMTRLKSVYFAKMLMCTFTLKGSIFGIYFPVLYLTITLSCLLTILMAYAKLFSITRRHERRIHGENPNARGGLAAPRLNKKTLHTMLIVVGSALLLTLIPVISMVVIFITRKAVLAFFLLGLPILINSWLNVFIYYLRNKEFRQVTKTLLLLYYQSVKRRICRTN